MRYLVNQITGELEKEAADLSIIAPKEKDIDNLSGTYDVGDQFIYRDKLYTITGVNPYTYEESDTLTKQLAGIQPDFDDLSGATATTDGERGLAPQPLAGDQDTFLSGGGSWEKNTTNLHSSFPSTDEITSETTEDGFTGYKNVLSYPFYESTITRNGVTFTDNGDGSVTTSGTATAYATFNIKSRLDTSGASTIPNGKYVLTGCPTGGSNSTYSITIQYRKNDINYVIGRDMGSGYAFELKGDDYSGDEVRVILQIVINNGINADGLTFRPMISPVDVSDENLITYPFWETTKTENGLTFTDNGDGTVTVNGTATASTTFRLKSRHDESGASTFSNGTYYLSGCPSYGYTNRYHIEALGLKNGSSSTSFGFPDVGNGTQIVLDGDDYGENEVRLTLWIKISNGVTVDNLTFTPKLQRIFSDESYVAPHTIPALTSGETHQSLFGKISAMFKNIRKLWNTVVSIKNNLTTKYNNNDVSFKFGVDADGNYGYYKDGADSVTPFNHHNDTYTPISRNAALDMGEIHRYRYVNTNSIPNTNSGTYTPDSNGTALDMGKANTYRYINTSTVYNLGVNAGKIFSNHYDVLNETSGATSGSSFVNYESYVYTVPSTLSGNYRCIIGVIATGGSADRAYCNVDWNNTNVIDGTGFGIGGGAGTHNQTGCNLKFVVLLNPVTNNAIRLYYRGVYVRKVVGFY